MSTFFELVIRDALITNIAGPLRLDQSKQRDPQSDLEDRNIPQINHALNAYNREGTNNKPLPYFHNSDSLNIGKIERPQDVFPAYAPSEGTQRNNLKPQEFANQNKNEKAGTDTNIIERESKNGLKIDLINSSNTEPNSSLEINSNVNLNTESNSFLETRSNISSNTESRHGSNPNLNSGFSLEKPEYQSQPVANTFKTTSLNELQRINSASDSLYSFNGYAKLRLVNEPDTQDAEAPEPKGLPREILMDRKYPKHTEQNDINPTHAALLTDSYSSPYSENDQKSTNNTEQPENKINFRVNSESLQNDEARLKTHSMDSLSTDTKHNHSNERTGSRNSIPELNFLITNSFYNTHQPQNQQTTSNESSVIIGQVDVFIDAPEVTKNSTNVGNSQNISPNTSTRYMRRL